MKIVLLSALSSIHTVRWANALSNKGHSVVVVSALNHRLYETLNTNIKVKYIPLHTPFAYIFGHLWVKRLLKKFRPNIVNAHYASGYGLLARITKYKPLVLSIWGTDVYDFPLQNIIKKHMLIRNIKNANCIVSTSHAMSKQVQSIVGDNINVSVVPFGVDTNKFSNTKTKSNNDIVIGTVKYLYKIYGVDILLKAYSLLYKSLCNSDPVLAKRLKLRIVGSGEEFKNLKELADRLDIIDKTVFVGKIPYDKVPCELNKLDIYVALSRMESFGVAVIEASSCGLPVIGSNVGGLPEVVVDNVTGIIVPKESPASAAKALEKVINEPGLITKMGEAGRKHVKDNYEWDNCVQMMEDVYANCRLESNY